MGTHLIALSEGFPMNTKMRGFRWFCTLDESNQELYVLLELYRDDKSFFSLIKLLLVPSYSMSGLFHGPWEWTEERDFSLRLYKSSHMP